MHVCARPVSLIRRACNAQFACKFNSLTLLVAITTAICRHHSLPHYTAQFRPEEISRMHSSANRFNRLVSRRKAGALFGGPYKNICPFLPM